MYNTHCHPNRGENPLDMREPWLKTTSISYHLHLLYEELSYPHLHMIVALLSATYRLG